MAYTAKKYSRINWKNRPSTATALGATNMNHMDVFLNDVDNALVEMEAAKLNIATANSMLKSVAYNKSTGVWNFQQLDGTSFSFDQNIEKIPVSFSLSESGVLTMTTEDGTQWECNVAELIKDYVFDDSGTIGFSKEFKSNEYHVSAIVKDGSIESKHLNPDYRSDIQSYMNTAQTAANDSLTYSKDSKRWAVGDASYSGSETDNSKYYKEKAEEAKTAAEKARDEAQAATGAQIMTQTKMGVGRPDGSTIGVTDGIFGLIAKAINLPAVDTSGIVGTAGEESTTQALLDELASRVVSKLVTNDALTTKLADYMTKSMMSGTHVNDASHVPTSALAYSMNQAIDTLNSNVTDLTSANRINVTVKAETNNLNSPERTGIYYVTGSNIAALPSGFASYGIIFNMRSPYTIHPTNANSVYVQIYIDVYNKRATRVFNNGKWTNWSTF